MGRISIGVCKHEHKIPQVIYSTYIYIYIYIYIYNVIIVFNSYIDMPGKPSFGTLTLLISVFSEVITRPFKTYYIFC